MAPRKIKTTSKRRAHTNTARKEANNNGNLKNASGSLERAFRRASMGRLCKKCKKRVADAIYQRHSEDCKILCSNNDEGSFDDGEIIFCGFVVPSPSTSAVASRKRIIHAVNADVAEHSLSCKLSQETNAHFNEQNSGHLASTISEDIDGMPLNDIYTLCMHYLEKFLGQYQTLSNSQSLQWSQRSNKENMISYDIRPNEHPSSFILDEEESNQQSSSSLSQQIHINIEKCSSEESRSARYFLRIVWHILQKVLLCPEHDCSNEQAVRFWGESLRLVLKFLSLSVEAQQLFVLLLRRRWGWHLARDTQMKYREIIPGDHSIHFEQMCKIGLMQSGSTLENTPLKEALKLLKKPDLLTLCKQFKIDGSGQHIPALLDKFTKLGEQRTIFGGKRKKIVLRSIRSITGEFFRIELGVLQLFTAFFTVFSPTHMDTAQLLEPHFNEELSGRLIYIVLQFHTGTLSFPSPSECSNSLIGVLESFEELMSYVDSKHLEEQIIRLINRHPPAFEEALECAKGAKAKLEKLLSDSSRMNLFRRLPIYLRKFSAPWVLSRCTFTGGIEIAQKLRNYELAVDWLKFLLETEDLRHFGKSSRGRWYERLALNLERHLKDNEQAIQYCRIGMQDELISEADKLILQIRLIKLIERLKKPLIAEPYFIQLNEPEKMEINGTTLAKGIGDGKQVNHFYIPKHNSQNERPEINKCTVEELALHYLLSKEGYTHGYHTEGTIWHALFRIFFDDIIFNGNVPNVWLSRVQDDPLDLNFNDFYINRKTAIEQRLKEILSTADPMSTYSPHLYNKVKSNVACDSHISWYNFPSFDHIIRFLRCCSPLLLHDLFRRLCVDFRGTRSGFPDLTVWNEQSASLAVVEVKGPNDSLSTKQQLWLHFFRSHGVRAVVCHVAAKNDRALN